MVTGLLYIYSEDEPFKSRTSRKTIEMLVKILGERFLDRVTVLLHSQGTFQNNLSNYMPSEDSPLYPLYCNNIKPWTMPFQHDPQYVEHILWRYTGLHPRLVHLAAMENFVQHDGGTPNWRYDNIPRHLREFFPEDIGSPMSVSQQDVRLRLREQTSGLERLQAKLQAREEQLMEFQRAKDEEISKLKLENDSRVNALQGELQARDEELMKLKMDIKSRESVDMVRAKESTPVETKAEVNRTIVKMEQQLERLRTLLAQKDDDIKALLSTHDAELKSIEKARQEESFNHEAGFKRLFNMAQDQAVEISQLKSSKDLALEQLESSKKKEISKLGSEIGGLQDKLQTKGEQLMKFQTAKDKEINELGSEKDVEIQELRGLVAQKEGEIKDLLSSHGVGLKNVQKFAHEIELNFKSLWETIQNQEKISNLGPSRGSGLKELEASKNEEFSKPGSKKGSNTKGPRVQAKNDRTETSKLDSEKDSIIKALQGQLQLKDEELMKLKTDGELGTRESMGAMETKEGGITQFETRVNDTITEPENNQGGRIHHLNPEIRLNNTEYGSPRYDMQLQEEPEQGGIVRALGDINRLIEEFGQSISEHIEKYMEGNPSGKVIQPQNLLNLFGQVGNKLASKVKQDPYVLFEYAVQATICDQLYMHLFKPFHPSIADDEKCGTFIMEMYSQMVYRESQSVAGRWRKDAFNSISRSGDTTLGMPDNRDGERMHRRITSTLSTLLGKIVEIPPHEVLKEHSRALNKVITKAEEFNRLLKGEVSILGDFQPIAFPFGEAFQPSYMSEVNSKPKKAKQPETILATVELGLIKRYALGGSRIPEETVLRKAVMFGLSK
ncbi:hypothetical protein FRC11_008145 [Ceratobasidium sp. 423]|nr:hypothetical protein FRC11_008145 [Ceratobasidium sp. 423]